VKNQRQLATKLLNTELREQPTRKTMPERPSQGHRQQLQTALLKESLRKREHPRRKMAKPLKRVKVTLKTLKSHELKVPNQNIERRARLMQLVKMEPLQEKQRRQKVMGKQREPKNVQRIPCIKIQWNSLRKGNSRINGRSIDLVNGRELVKPLLQWKLSSLRGQLNCSRLLMRRHSTLAETRLRRKSKISVYNWRRRKLYLKKLLLPRRHL
jgi:hypothetical protein